jgi:hypothetical protein
MDVSEPKKRIVVDGVEFSQIFFFPKILACVLSALQPTRLTIGLLMVAALITFGRIWDGLAPAPIHPDGLTAGNATAADTTALQQTLLRGLFEFAPDRAPASGTELDVDEAQHWIEEGYRRQRHDADDETEVAAIDANFASVILAIDASRPKGAFEALAKHVGAGVSALVQSVLELRPADACDSIARLLVAGPRALWRQAPWFTVAFGLLVILVLAVGGGALARMAACQVAGGERLSIRAAIDFSLQRWSALSWAQVLPAILALILCGLTALFGVLLIAPVIDILGGVAYGLALVLGFLITFLLLGYAVGYALLVPAIACENCDGADAVQRAYAYTVTRPLHLLVYWFVAIVGLTLGFLLVSLVAALTLNLAADLVSSTTDNPAMSITGGYGVFDLSHQRLHDTGRWHSTWAAEAIQFWQSVVVCLVWAWVLAYCFCAATVVYLLMRRLCDGQEIDDIWRPGETMSPEAIDVDVN